FQRLGHLQEQPMVGGDLATLYPLRMAAGMLHDVVDVEGWLLSENKRFPHGKTETQIIVKQLEKESLLKTTSCGRVLDAVSAILGICYERTYEGEPAMKLESVAMKGKDMLSLTSEIRGNTVDTTLLVHEIFNERSKQSVADLAFSAESYLANGLAQLAVENAERLNVKTIGFSGGVAYNERITQAIRKNVEKNGFRFVVHNMVPPGDGGIAFGQTIAASLVAH
ncbi:MAG: carbamoyltransferase HypF, partial [Candidatus Bathyarchaeota archaeon]|nr:carbamoyltransferase HypF [Candidatus Bathyarchaeota archaeon]